MLVNPHAGWVTITLGDFIDRASYLTNVPEDCLDALAYGIENRKPVAVWFDAEGWEYTITFTYDETYIVRQDDEAKHELFVIDKSIEQIAKEVISDIERDYDAWLKWDLDLYMESKVEIPEKLKKLKSLVKEKEIYKTCPDDYSFEVGM